METKNKFGEELSDIVEKAQANEEKRVKENEIATFRKEYNEEKVKNKEWDERLSVIYKENGEI
jgi:hypothetical protein